MIDYYVYLILVCAPDCHLKFSLLILLLDAFASWIGSSFLNKVLLFFLLVLFNHLELLFPGFIKHGKGRLIDTRLELGEKFEQLQHHDSLGQYLWVFCIAKVIVKLNLDAAWPAEITGVHLVLNHKIFNGGKSHLQVRQHVSI